MSAPLDNHDHYMHEALALAARGVGHVSPNPLVGCVIVRDDTIVGRGWHQAAGTPHAEAHALNEAGDAARGARVYVTLEPCNHHGRTPPCSEALIDAGVAEVIIAIRDPNPRASGGIERLHEAGIRTVLGPGEREARWQNRFFLHHLENRRPWVIAKFAASLDGRSATRGGDSQWITGSAARFAGHRVRHAVDAILVGRATVEMDDPSLTVRHPDIDRPAHPLRVVLDTQARLGPNYQVFAAENPGKCLHVTATSPKHAEVAHGVEQLQLTSLRDSRLDLEQLLDALGARGIQSVLVEGGATLLGAFHDQRLINELHVFQAPMVIGGGKAHPAIAGEGAGKLSEATRLEWLNIEQLGDDLHLHARVRDKTEALH